MMNNPLYNEQEIKATLEEKGIHIVWYAIYKAPKLPTETGEFYGKTPLFQQAIDIINKQKERGHTMFLKVQCDDGTERDIL